MGSCSEEGTVEPLPGLAVALVLCALWQGQVVPSSPGAVGRGVSALRLRAAQQTGRKKEGSRSAMLQHRGLGEILG